jgi:hypothetical protein
VHLSPYLQATQMAEDAWFPMSCLNKWLEVFTTKLQHDPGFWRR